MKKIAVLFLFFTSVLFAQNSEIDSLTNILKSATNPYTKAKINLQLAKMYERVDLSEARNHVIEALKFEENDSLLAESHNQLGRFFFFTAKLDSAAIHFEKTKTLLKKLKNEKQLAVVNISLGAVQLRQGDYNKTIKTLTESASFFEETKDSLNAAKCYSNIASAFAELELYPKAIEYSERALQTFQKLKQTPFELITLPNLATQHYKNGDTIRAIAYNAKAEELATSLGDKRSLSIIYNNLGDIYLDKDPEKSKQYLEKTLQLKNEMNLKSGLGITQSNLGYIHLKNKEYRRAISYFDEASKQVKGKQLAMLYNNMKEAYKGIGNSTKALEFSEKSKNLNDSILNTENENNFLEIQTKYETEKKEKEILELKTINQKTEFQRITNRNYLLLALLALCITLVIAYLLVKNSKRKQVIAMQEATIKNQEIEQLIKTQELQGIDAIIDAQEKERSKIAADLHDNLGSKMATLKLYLDSFDDKAGFDSFHGKLKELTNSTYSEIRKIAHKKNFGTFINKGLIPSTQLIADQISESNRIRIAVINIDVDQRVENAIEIQVFRVIQELLTNIIKHAKATEVTIQFSEIDETLHIMIEDNGRGFNSEKVSRGLGLLNIKKRMEKINGEVVIDSSEGNGTTVILTIPL